MEPAYVAPEPQLHQQRSKLRRKRFLRTHLTAYAFLTPIFISMGLFKYVPFFTALLKSFYEWNGANINKFVGFANFNRLLHDMTFYISLKNIALFTLSFLVIQLTFPLLGAVLVHHLRHSRLKSTVQSLFLLPLVVPSIIIFLLWRWMYASNGVINSFLGFMGLDTWKHAWLGESATAIGAIVMVNFPWIGGISFLIYMAGLSAISVDLYEVGKMEGISPLRRFWSIELPLIRGQIRFVLLLSFIHQFQSFENVLVLTNGGPGFSTLTPALYLYKMGFEYNELGMASAIGVVIFMLLLIFTVWIQRAIRNADTAD
jgi:raffinose/stachyose/melibiose transport system permease protein